MQQCPNMFKADGEFWKMANCEGVTALVTLMLAIWSKIRVLESKFVTKEGPAWSQGGRVGMSVVRFPNPLFEVGWDYTAPIGGEFFFPPSQRGQFGQDMAVRVLIGFLNI